MTAGSESDHMGPEELSSRAVAGVGADEHIGFSRFLRVPTTVCGIPKTSDSSPRPQTQKDKWERLVRGGGHRAADHARRGDRC